MSFMQLIRPAFSRGESRAHIFWFLLTGFSWLILGHLCLVRERRTGQPTPAFVGWELLAMAVLGPGQFYEDKETLIESLDEVALLESQTIYLSHREYIDNAILKNAIATLKEQ